jgi:hypothetical protein
MAQELIDRVGKGASFAATADAMKIPHRVDGPFTRINPPVPEAIVVGAAFGLDSGQTSAVLEGKNGLFVAYGLGRTKADSADFAKSLDALRTEVVRLDRQARVRSYLAGLQSAAKIVDRRAKVFQTEAQAEAAAQSRASTTRQ